jgi:hypothetical protein
MWSLCQGRMLDLVSTYVWVPRRANNHKEEERFVAQPIPYTKLLVQQTARILMTGN